MRRVAALAALAAVLAGCGAGGNGSAVESELRAYVAGTGITVRDGSCVDMDFEKHGLHLWNCSVIVPRTVLTPETERRWDVAVNGSGAIADASPHR